MPVSIIKNNSFISPFKKKMSTLLFGNQLDCEEMNYYIFLKKESRKHVFWFINRLYKEVTQYLSPSQGANTDFDTGGAWGMFSGVFSFFNK